MSDTALAAAPAARPLTHARWWRQDAVEFRGFIALIQSLGVRRYLEVGANNGDTFKLVVDAMGPGSFGMAVDLPWDTESRHNLMRSAADCKDAVTDVIIGNSWDADVVARVRRAAPFDLVLIDADHTYEGARRDWENYGGMATAVAFHDIAAPEGHLSSGEEVGVPQLWGELKPHFRHREIVRVGSKMGFGILYRGEQ